MFELLKINLRMFDVQVTTQESLSPENKTFYDKNLIRLTKPELVHDQFGQKKPIPKRGGKTIEFRKFSPLGKAVTPLVEGVTPKGNSLEVTAITAKVEQYGDYITVSDMLDLTAIDNTMAETSELLAAQAGVTLDTITREIINAGTNVQYGESAVDARYLLEGGKEEGNHYLTVDCIKRAVRALKKNNAKKIDGSYVAIIHPDITYDITSDPLWENVKTYCDPKDMYNGEIGRLHGVRFVETSEAKIFHGEDLTTENRNLTVKSYSGKVVTVNEAISAEEATALVGRKVIIGSELFTIESATAGGSGSASFTVHETPIADTPAQGDVVYPGEGGAQGRDVYPTLVIGSNAYGVTEIEGGGLQMKIKQLGSAGTADPLDQRASVGWKATKTAEILVDEFMVRIETASTFESGAN